MREDGMDMYGAKSIRINRDRLQCHAHPNQSAEAGSFATRPHAVARMVFLI